MRLAECFREAVREGATALVLVHNHPSGRPEPSPEDVRLTDDAARAGELLGVEVLDHVILGRSGFSSLRATGLYTPRPTQGEAAERPRAAWTADGPDRSAPAGGGRSAEPRRAPPSGSRRQHPL